MLIKYGNQVAKDFFENYFLMMFQPYNYVKENHKKNIQIWQEMGLYPEGLKMPDDLSDSISNTKNIQNLELSENTKSGEGYSETINVWKQA